MSTGTGSAARRVVVSVVLLFASSTTSAAQFLGARDIDSLPSRPADARIPYGRDSLQFGELRLPAGSGPFPVAIVLHGGCWQSRFATLRNTAALADALRDAGIATWNVEYRRADHPGGGWPGTFLDAAAATDQLRELARQYPLDLSRVVAVGHSAGGHLALWLAARRRLPAQSEVTTANPLPLRGAVSLGGPGDIAEFLARGGGPSAPCTSGIVRLMGGEPSAHPVRYALGSPLHLLPLGVPHAVIAGDNDRIVPPPARAAWAEAAQRAGDVVENITIPNAGHFEVIAPKSRAWPEVLRVIQALVK